MVCSANGDKSLLLKHKHLCIFKTIGRCNKKDWDQTVGSLIGQTKESDATVTLSYSLVPFQDQALAWLIIGS